jgi:Zinc carboxypeptidase/Secretion system C-terminal sorting domain/Carboxypeptidase regulatory-like domain
MNLKDYLMYNLKTILFISLLSFNVFSQQVEHKYFEVNREIYFRFLAPRDVINNLSPVISIANIRGDSVYAFANEKEYLSFLKYEIPCTILPPPGLQNELRMGNNLAKISSWDTYPTYNAYVQLMTQFQTAHPNICKIIEVGTTVQGRKLLFAKITQNVDVKGAKPQFMYSSSMHGNETVGYLMMLRLIDTLVNSYGTDSRITNMINSVEIWINPLANPDGTYHNNDTTVNGATRYNANGIDLNRNFPDPSAGQHPDGNAWQPETISIMNLESNNNFSLAANFHSGAEVVNYPWDTWKKLHPDNLWYQFISRRFADTVHAYSVPGYMTDLGNGITDGYAWYQVEGGRQDYMNYFSRGREVTIELSSIYILPASLSSSYWNYLSHSLLDFIENTYYGIRGTITDSHGNPVKALVSIAGHDADNSSIYSDSVTGSYFRMIAPGTYSVSFNADSFLTQTVTNITVKKDSASLLNIRLDRNLSAVISSPNSTPTQYSLSQNYPNPFNPSTTIKYQLPQSGNVSLKVYDVLGREVASLANGFKSAGSYTITFNSSSLPSGIYFYQLKVNDYLSLKKMILLK